MIFGSFLELNIIKCYYCHEMKKNFYPIFIFLLFLFPANLSFGQVSEETSQGEIARLSQELTALKSQVDTLEAYVREKDEKVVDLTKQLVDFALKLSEKEILLSKKIEELVLLNDELVDVRSRLELGQRIMQEKDTKIKEMERSFGLLSSQVIREEAAQKDILTVKEAETAQLNGFLEIYKEMLKDSKQTILDKERESETLKEQLLILVKQQKLGEITIQNKDKEIESLKHMVNRFRERQSSAQKKVDPALSEMRDSFQHVLSLDEKLIMLEKILLSKNKMLQKANQDLLSLEDRFYSAKEEFVKSKESTGNGPFVYRKMNKQLLAMYHQLKSIHSFLGKQLNDFDKLANPSFVLTQGRSNVR